MNDANYALHNLQKTLDIHIMPEWYISCNMNSLNCTTNNFPFTPWSKEMIFCAPSISSTLNSTHCIFNGEHSIVHHKNIKLLHNNPNIFNRVRVRLDDQKNWNDKLYVRTMLSIIYVRMCWWIRKNIIFLRRYIIFLRDEQLAFQMSFSINELLFDT